VIIAQNKSFLELGLKYPGLTCPGDKMCYEREKKLTHKRELTYETSHPFCINDVSLKFIIMPK
jgi:hypothetical protein